MPLGVFYERDSDLLEDSCTIRTLISWLACNVCARAAGARINLTTKKRLFTKTNRNGRNMQARWLLYRRCAKKAGRCAAQVAMQMRERFYPIAEFGGFFSFEHMLISAINRVERSASANIKSFDTPRAQTMPDYRDYTHNWSLCLIHIHGKWLQPLTKQFLRRHWWMGIALSD